MAEEREQLEITALKDDYETKYGFKSPEDYTFKSRKGLDREIVQEISYLKGEPDWMRDFRLHALEVFEGKPVPTWGANILGMDFNDFYYYVRASDQEGRDWDDIPEGVKATFDKLGVPEAEQKFLAGLGAQYESEMIYHRVKDNLAKQGVIFESIDTGLKEYPDLFREYFATVVPPTDNKFAALNSAVWSGGSFIYVPPGVHIDMPLQAYFRINSANMGQFERTLIIVDEGAFLHYVEGCTAPIYSTDSLHSGVIEIIVKKGGRCRYTTIQNWSTNVYNLVSQRAMVEAEGTMEWVDSNLGSKVTMKYPAVFMMGPGASGEILSMAFSSRGQHHDAGGKMVHAAPHTTSKITSKSISMHGGRSSYRGLVRVQEGAHGSKSSVACDALILDDHSISDTYPYIEVDEADVEIGHEASVSKVSADQLYYLMSRGLDEDQANAIVVSGFIEPLVKELPMEYAVEMNRLVKLQMEGSIG